MLLRAHSPENRLALETPEWFQKHVDDGRKLWVFHHIPKTAGSSISLEIEQLLQPSYNFSLDSRRADQQELGTDARHDLIIDDFLQFHGQTPFRFAHGHLRRRHVEKLRASLDAVAFFTFLREPFSRMVSSFRYLQTNMHPGSDDFIRAYPNFQSFVTSSVGEARNQRNAMCKYITGNKSDPSHEEAIEILEREYSFVGLLEMYPYSFRTLTSLLRNRRQPTIHERKTPSKVANDIDDPARYRREILALNREDAKLYKYFRDRLLEGRDRIRSEAS